MNLFGKKKKAPQADPAETIMNLRNHLDTLDKREAHIQRKVDASLVEAKQKLNRKDKKGAMFALKKKKLYEDEIAKLHGARITLENQIMALEGAAVNVETFRAMESGAQAMRAVRGNIDAERVDEMMDDIQEEKDIMDQISDAISRPAQDMFDDEDLLAELEDLEEAELQSTLLQAPAAPVAAPARATPQATTATTLPSMPEAPQTSITVEGEADDEELRALRDLEAAMAM